MPHTPQPPPVWPQAPSVLPGWQLPFWQQPPLHAVCAAAPHAVEQRCETVLQLLPVGQSPAALQPQLPLRHKWPLAESVQSMQALPLAPQALLLPPVAQLVPAQQPPLHGCEALQVVVQA